MNDLLKETLLSRASKYEVWGTLDSLGALAQELKRAMREHAGGQPWDLLRGMQAEALDMIQHKAARIINGDADFIDSWDDIAGYATRVADLLRELERVRAEQGPMMPNPMEQTTGMDFVQPNWEKQVRELEDELEAERGASKKSGGGILDKARKAEKLEFEISEAYAAAVAAESESVRYGAGPLYSGRNRANPVDPLDPDNDGWPTLDRPARVGCATFDTGVSTKLVVMAAQDQHEIHQVEGRRTVRPVPGMSAEEIVKKATAQAFIKEGPGRHGGHGG